MCAAPSLTLSYPFSIVVARSARSLSSTRVWDCTGSCPGGPCQPTRARPLRSLPLLEATNACCWRSHRRAPRDLFTAKRASYDNPPDGKCWLSTSRITTVCIQVNNDTSSKRPSPQLSRVWGTCRWALRHPMARPCVTAQAPATA
ncbi:uncharacterized protein B0I36DRAFT_330299 [Microdochium trichocladiopsis]|uniref:Uncharacterized protein n=1 Tax=Microdochium trichocladiopsis TaxID=1682393 RepID=A0A9P8Y017_9PEZI|nr:uncharacterized protein B0I36DRAFT_330299 [Microdochium trichocladiopsis]KAH7026282.1 hypothetical protein B0I36DRAFT_330299 [Microdochium trichocladiopsis]